MSDWNRYLAILTDRADDRTFAVYVSGVTIDSAHGKIVEAYPARQFSLDKLEPTIEDPLSDPYAFKGYKR